MKLYHKNPQKHPSNPWKWIPTLYIAEGLPYFAVNTLTVLMYTNLGVSKADMAFFTGWLYLPWVIKPFWSPFVDIFKTKRSWALAMQLLMGLTMAGVALFLVTEWWFALSLAIFWLMAFFSATHDVAADGFYILALDERQQASYVGVRSTFYRIASVVGQGGLVILAGWLESTTGNIPLAWSLTFTILALFFVGIFFYHCFVMPYPSADFPTPGKTVRSILRDFVDTFITFFRKPHIITALLFMLLYRLPEALCIKMIQPFLKDSYADGGLALSTSEIGIVNGTIGVIALLAGGICGGLAIARGGLRKWLWPMALSLTLPCLVYCYMAALQPDSFLLISSLIGIEQFGYGYGFTAFMMYLMYFSKGENATSHYAFCTAFMALGMMLPGMMAGWLFELIEKASKVCFPNILIETEYFHAASSGYLGFFILVMVTSLATFGVTYGVWRKQPEDDVEISQNQRNNQ